ncbi:MAG TPA: TIGR04255 family protein [Terracidiphilus sp.]
MSRRGSYIPKKLKYDAIIESIVELRFETTTRPEFLLVRLAEMDAWKGFTESRLPAYSLPEPLRDVDPNLRYQPIFELQKDQRSLRIGPRVISYHLRKPYNGWAAFGSEVATVVNALFSKVEAPVIKRLGFRYLNALTQEFHGIRGVSDLDIAVQIGQQTVSDGININVKMKISDDTNCLVKVATPTFVTGSLSAETTVMADIDVFTPEPFETTDSSIAIKWIDNAHEAEKREFFVLLKHETIAALEEK